MCIQLLSSSTQTHIYRSKMRSLLAISSFILCFASVAYANQGLAIYYDPNQSGRYTPSACYGDVDKGAMVAGVNDKLWDGGKACGRRYRVFCTGPANEFTNPCKRLKQVVVTVVDYCSSICYGDINLSKSAFQQIANPIAGKVKIQYTQI